MSFRIMQLLSVLATAPFGAAFLLSPASVSSLYGITDWNSGTLVIARLFGTTLLMVAGVALSCLHVQDIESQRRLALSNAITSAVGAVVSLQSTISGTTNVLMWTTVALFGFFVVGWLGCWISAGHRTASHQHA